MCLKVMSFKNCPFSTTWMLSISSIGEHISNRAYKQQFSLCKGNLNI